MSTQNPHLDSPHEASGDDAIQPHAPDFIEMPEVPSLSMENEPVPIWLYILCGFMLFLAGSSFTGLDVFGHGLLDQGPGGPAIASAGATTEAPATPIELGKKIYSNNCASCHDNSGSGSPGKYPPMVASEYVIGSKERLAAILLKGIDGTLEVKGASYSGNVMPAQEAILSPEKMANLMTFLRGTWGNTAGPVSVDDVTKAKAKFASQTAAWSQAQLMAIAPNGPDPSDKK
jgi:mono/diheme cytochrome c family protein